MLYILVTVGGACSVVAAAAQLSAPIRDSSTSRVGERGGVSLKPKACETGPTCNAKHLVNSQ